MRRISVTRGVAIGAAAVLTAASFFISGLTGAASPDVPLTDGAADWHTLAMLLQLTGVVLLVTIILVAEWRTGKALRRLDDERCDLVRAAAERDGAVDLATHAATQLAESELRYRGIFENRGTGMAICGLVDAQFLQVNGSLCDLLGYTAEELQQASLLTMTHHDDLPNAAALQRAIAGGAPGPFLTERRFVTKEGKVITGQVTMSVARDDTGRARFCAAQILDITRWRRAEENAVRYATELKHQAQTDELTGLYNRRGFRTASEHCCAAQSRNRQPLMLAAIDVDYLKAINDTWGHAKGDEAIMVVAIALKQAFRTSDIVARVGGDEFLCLLPNAGNDDVEQIRMRIAARIARERDALLDAVPVTVTVGVAIAPPLTSVDMDRLMREADRALYEAKRNRPGRDAFLAKLA